MTDTNNQENICMICYDPLDIECGRVIIKCGHMYCPSCFMEHMKRDNHCAMCRGVVKINKRVINDDNRRDWVQSLTTTFMKSDTMNHVYSELCLEMSNLILSKIVPNISRTQDNTIMVNNIIESYVPTITFVSIRGMITKLTQITVDTTSNWYENVNIQPIQFRDRVVVMQGMSSHELRTRDEEIRDGRTGGHWGVFMDPLGTEEII